MPDLFISYAREDRETALALAQALQSHGIDVWWDRELTGGGDFAAEIERHLRAAPVAIVLWSAASVLSDFVRDESSRARDMGTLLPVRIGTVELPLGFGTLHTLDLLAWDGDPGDEACQALIAQVRQRLAAAGPGSGRAAPAGEPRPGPPPGETTLGQRRRRRRVVLGLGLAGAAGIAGLGAFGWQRFTQREAIAHLGQALEDHFAAPPRLERAQSGYANALALDDALAPAHYYLAHLYAQLMLRGEPPPAGEVLEALRADARGHFQRALDHAERLDGAQRVVARSQLALLGQADAAPPITRPVPNGETGAEAPPVRIDPPEPVRPPATIGGTRPSEDIGAGRPSTPTAPVAPGEPSPTGDAPTGTDRIRVRLPRVPAPAAVAEAARSSSQALFGADRDARLAASTALTLDPAAAAEALPSAIALARRALASAPQAEPTAHGIAATLALLQRASPASLRASQPALRGLLDELAASPLAGAHRAAAAQVAGALQRSFGRRPVAYLQIARESQRPIAEALARRLADAGYVTPAIELTGEARAPARPSLRAQGASDPELARWCQRALAEAAGAPADAAVLRRAQPATDTYELWFDKALCAPGGRQAPGCGT